MLSEWLLIIVTILLSGFFSGSEIAFVSANRLKLELLMRRNEAGSPQLGFYIKNPEAFLITTLVGNNIINITYATLMTLFLKDTLVNVYASVFDFPPSELILLSMQTILASVLIMYTGEIVPKAIFRSHADRLLPILAPLMRLLNYLILPLIFISNKSSNLVLRLIGFKNTPVEQIFHRHDIELILRELHETGGSSELDRDDTELLTNVLELSSKRVKDSMVTRTEIVAVDVSTPIHEVHKLFLTSGYSKIPVYEDSIDNIIGVLFAYDLFEKPETIRSVMRPVKMVPYSKRSKNLLAEFRQSNTSLAIVLDEYGGTAGLVTIEDIIEEVVGDIEDEYDTNELILKKLNDTTYVMSGGVELEDLMDTYPDLSLPVEESEYETVGGLIIHQEGRIPKVNEEIMIDRYKFIISKASPSRIETVRLLVLEKD